MASGRRVGAANHDPIRYMIKRPVPKRPDRVCSEERGT